MEEPPELATRASLPAISLAAASLSGSVEPRPGDERERSRTNDRRARGAGRRTGRREQGGRGVGEQEEQSGPGGLAGPAVTALASVAAAGVSYYAVRRAFARNGAGESSEEAGDDSPASRRQEPEDSSDEQDEEATDGASAPDDEHDEDAGDDDEADESESEPQAGRAGGSGLL